MFWVGLILSVVMGLAGIPPIRDWVCERFKIEEKQFSRTRVVLILFGALIAGFIHIQKSNESSTLREIARQTQEKLEKERQERIDVEQKRRIPPKLTAILETDPFLGGSQAISIGILIRPENLVPFEYYYIINTTDDKDKVIGTPSSGIWTKMIPIKNAQSFRKVGINWEAIKGMKLVMRFYFRSLTPDLFNEPGHQGSITKRYRMEDNGILVPIE